ncbi:hypothetical protein QP735_07610 [Curtobacterium citreum]|uniref:hypothetical protein n=1 Tax=Curtobacterium citreum TaxID=2036 RepID=UPI00254B5F8E|nr:hypothetical protein [Curtobacterium citreum]MDK8172397.1 hypothetical protein [Curtobacterium citreum]
MDNIDFAETPFVVMVTADKTPSKTGVTWAGPVACTEARARLQAGYGGAIWLTQGRVLGPHSDPDSELLLGLLLWRSGSEAESFAEGTRRTRVDGDLHAGLVLDDGVYRFSATVSASTDRGTGAESTSTQSETAHEVITMTPDRGKQEWIGEYNESETRDHIRHLDGFVSTSFFRDLRSDRIIEYVQWRSADDLTAALDDERFAEHMSVNSHYSTGEARLFGERSTDQA